MGAYTNIDDPSALFQATTYTGAGANTAVTNGGNSDLKPDLLWIKNRTAGYAHFVVDSNRNISYAQNSSNAPYLEAEGTSAENNNQNWMQSVNTDGFTTGIAEHTNCNSGSAYVAWQWKANGGTTANNTTGSIDSVVQANTNAGFSIVTYTGGGSAGTIGHGLGVKPDVIILKKRNGAVHWYVRHVSTGSSHLVLSLSSNAASVPSVTWTTTEPTSSVFSIGSGADFNANGGTFIAYCWAEKQGFSKFGSYEGTGNANGPFVATGFKPAFVMVKNIDNSGYDWAIMDSTRTPTNANGTYEFLWANLSAAEFTDGDSGINMEIDFLSNGFKIRTARGELNLQSTFIYMAFAENPFVTSSGVPTTAR